MKLTDESITQTCDNYLDYEREGNFVISEGDPSRCWNCWFYCSEDNWCWQFDENLELGPVEGIECEGYTEINEGSAKIYFSCFACNRFKKCEKKKNIKIAEGCNLIQLEVKS